MKTTLKWLLITLLTGSMVAQEATPATTGTAKARPQTSHARKSAAKAADSTLSDQIRELREMMLQQQQQINALQQEMRQRDQQLQQAQQQTQEAQQAAAQAQASAAEAQTTAESQKQSLAQAQSDLKDVQVTLTNAANETQTQQKSLSEKLSVLDRFRLSGDIRVRQEDFFAGCNGNLPGCSPRVRERVRLRIGIDGKLGQDFLGGVALASGAVTDPTSTNETLTNVFERKTIGFDRGYISYQPQNHKWLQVWGGKFAYTWQRTSYTFDPDLNPEGFTEKLSFDLTGPVIKNINLQGIQLLYNEVSQGADSFAAGFQAGTRLALGKRVTTSPSFTVLNWRNNNVILNEPASVTGGSGVGAFAPNGITNCTIGASPNRTYCSRFLYADFILPVTVKTGWEKLPFNLVAEYLQNLNAEPALLQGGGTIAPQDKAYGVDLGFGQQKNKGDVQFGYEFRRQEQDSAIASFNESDQRAPTNIVQHRMYFLYKIRNNVQGAYTLWIGRTLNTSLVNAPRAGGVAVGQTDAWLKRMQFDLIYSF
jgi:hypothetical protein